MAALGPYTVGQVGVGGYDAFVHSVGLVTKAIGVTIDWTAVTAEAAPRTLPGTFTTTVGDKIIEAGTILTKVTPGTGSSKYRVALAADTLVRGECFVARGHISQILQADQVGAVTDEGTVALAALKVGGIYPTLANFLAAFPGIHLQKDA